MDFQNRTVVVTGGTGALGRAVVGALLVVAAGYMAVKKHRPLQLDEILAGVGLVIWIIVDRISEGMFGTDAVKIWSVRGVLLVVLLIAYMIARSRSQGSAAEKA